jgi:hypothetical protein
LLVEGSEKRLGMGLSGKIQLTGQDQMSKV